MKVNSIKFGNHQGQEVLLYHLINDHGMEVKIMTYGATITSISLPNTNASNTEVVCGFDDFESYHSEDYQSNAPYFGCTVGRYASRIKDGSFNINGKDYTLAVNNGANHLHGGIVGFDKKIWESAPIENEQNVGVKMSLKSAHLEEGYPGNVNVSVTFLLNNQNEISINYEGKTDEETPLSLTNHTYFNLSGFKESIFNHKAQILSKHHLIPDETNVPLGNLEAITNTAANLNEAIPLATPLTQLETGFEHYYIFDHPLGILSEVAFFEEPKSGRQLIIATTEPGMLFYTGYFTSDKLKRESGDVYGKYMAFCCETSRYPNGPNITDSPGSTTKPNQTYQSTTKFIFR